jgi:hypothetical protein
MTARERLRRIILARAEAQGTAGVLLAGIDPTIGGRFVPRHEVQAAAGALIAEGLVVGSMGAAPESVLRTADYARLAPLFEAECRRRGYGPRRRGIPVAGRAGPGRFGGAA